jgi:hypothetical protein
LVENVKVKGMIGREELKCFERNGRFSEEE